MRTMTSRTETNVVSEAAVDRGSHQEPVLKVTNLT